MVTSRPNSLAADRESTPISAAQQDPTLALLTDLFPALKRNLRIAVIYNGNTQKPGAVLHATFNARSSKSYQPVAEDIAATLRQAGFQHVVTLSDDMTLGERLAEEKVDFAWLNTAGIQGEICASHTAGMLEMMGIPYVGHNPLNASLLDTKHAFKHGLRAQGIATADFVTWDPRHGPFSHREDRRFQRVFRGCQGPFIVKPTSGRASLNVSVVERLEDLDAEVNRTGELTGNTVLIESFLAGEEFTVGVFGPVMYRQGGIHLHSEPVVVAPVRRVLDGGEKIFTSMDVKPITSDRAQLVPPTDQVRDELAALARGIYRDFLLTTLVRLDVRADASGALHVLEANPKPDLKRPARGVTNLIAIGLEELGMTYDDLIVSLFLNSLYGYLRYKRVCVSHILERLEY